jgi:hypothetical protein
LFRNVGGMLNVSMASASMHVSIVPTPKTVAINWLEREARRRFCCHIRIIVVSLDRTQSFCRGSAMA